jgi:hypothetical protein
MRTQQINVESCLRTDFFGDTVTLPWSQELEDALVLINKACEKQRHEMLTRMRDDYLGKQYHELMKNIENGIKCREILREISAYDFQKGGK